MSDRLAGLRARWQRVRPASGTLGNSANAGLTGAIGGIPDGMAAATLVGVSPIHGLFAAAAGRIGGGLSSSSQLMVITTTSAAALAAGSALSSVPAEDRLNALFLLTMVAGGLMLAAGLFGLGRLAGFVSHSVMLGFLTGVAVNIVFSQVPVMAGVDATAGTSIGKAWEVVTSPGTWHWTSLFISALAIALLTGLARTRLAGFAALIALLVTGGLVWALGADTVVLVNDVGEITRGLPLPQLPRIGLLSVDLVIGAAAVAAIVLVQGAGVRESAPNPDGRRADLDTDFAAQGIANLASGFLKGIPVGGSVGQTAVNVAAGARDRWAAILSGGWILLVLVALSGAVGLVPMPTLAGVLVVASIGAIRPRQLATVWRTGTQSQVAMVTTFVATLVLPVAAAVGIGAALSLLMQANRESIDLRLVHLVPDPATDTFVEEDAPATLTSGEPTVLDVHGSLFYAGARTLEALLPDPAGVEAPVVVLRLRGRATLGATAYSVLASYARRLQVQGGRLFVSGVDPALAQSFRHVVAPEVQSAIEVHEAVPTLGASTREALADAQAFLLVDDPEDPAPERPTGHRRAPITRAWDWVRDHLHRDDAST
ncbi:MAG TPA: SulP family inorganic anion transporter [Nitriliruptoraceae bacterium]|nr:SulP family inorganic anion transporter [Nitriliruptoraceae bacterium]